MSETGKITLSEWWQYEIRTIKQALSEIRAAIFFRGGTLAIITAVLTYFGLIWAGVSERHETAVRCIVSACAGLVAFLLFFGVEFLFKLLRAPVKMAKESEEKFGSEKQQFETTIDILKSQLAPPLSSAASELLIEAAKGGGSIFYSVGYGSIGISVNKREFIEPNNPRSSAQWKSALDELVSANYVEVGEMFYPLTAKGYAEADRLSGTHKTT
jgi:hypothetical protein